MRTFERKVDAEAHLVSVESSKLAGAYVDQSAGRVRFSQYAESWAAAQPHRGSTAQSVRSILDRHILPNFGSRPIATICPSEVQAWVAGLELAPSTVHVMYGKLAAIFRAAVADRVIATSPCNPRKIRLPAPTATRSCRCRPTMCARWPRRCPPTTARS
jgi:hypothetical protein